MCVYTFSPCILADISLILYGRSNYVSIEIKHSLTCYGTGQAKSNICFPLISLTYVLVSLPQIMLSLYFQAMLRTRQYQRKTLGLLHYFTTHLVKASQSTLASEKLSLTDQKFDAIVIGGGHNGLTSAAYLAKAGLNVVVLEKRHIIGGAAVTEEIIPGFKFSRCSYVLSLLRPKIIEDLKLKEHGLKVHSRDPFSFVPLRQPSTDPEGPKYLLLGANMEENKRQIGQFSEKDANAYPKYEEFIEKLVIAVAPLLDEPAPNVHKFLEGSVFSKLRHYKSVLPLARLMKSLGRESLSFYELLTTPASKFLDGWFESEPLKASLATDAVIGAMVSPHTPGSSYVFLHHLVGQANGVIGAWGYPEGGMGAVSGAIAKAATNFGATIETEADVREIVVSENETKGVVLADGRFIKSSIVLSNATPEVTFLKLVDESYLPEDFVSNVARINYTSPVTKINVAVDRLPNFKVAPNNRDGTPSPHHRCTIHLNSESIEEVHNAYIDAQRGQYSSEPIIEMCIPSSLDPTLAPPGKHVVSLFNQYTPYNLRDGQWDDETREKFADKVFDVIEDYAPGFKESVVGRDILSPPDLERIFGLTGGNIFHGAISLDQLYFMRPVPSMANYESPIDGLYLCGSGAHPGGGVMGAPGYQAALAALRKMGKKV